MQLAMTRVESLASDVAVVAARKLPSEALLCGNGHHPAIRVSIEAAAAADLLIVSTPIYKAAYSGLLKIWLDLLPADALRGKTVLPLATGGSGSHLLALDYTLRPVLHALGARDILDGVFAADAQLPPHESGGFLPDATILDRLDRALDPVVARYAAGASQFRCSA